MCVCVGEKLQVCFLFSVRVTLSRKLLLSRVWRLDQGHRGHPLVIKLLAVLMCLFTQANMHLQSILQRTHTQTQSDCQCLDSVWGLIRAGSRRDSRAERNLQDIICYSSANVWSEVKALSLILEENWKCNEFLQTSSLTWSSFVVGICLTEAVGRWRWVCVLMFESVWCCACVCCSARAGERNDTLEETAAGTGAHALTLSGCWREGSCQTWETRTSGHPQPAEQVQMSHLSLHLQFRCYCACVMSKCCV